MSKNTAIYDNLSDEQLMILFQGNRDEVIFQVVYNRYFQLLCKYVHWNLNSQLHTEDIAQNILIKLYNTPTLFDANKNLKVWLFVAIKNQIKNESRNSATRSKHLSILGHDIENTANSEPDSNDSAKLIRIRNSINQLSQDHREVITLKYSNNLTIKEISEVLECSEGTIKSRLFYAIQKMKEHVLSKTH